MNKISFSWNITLKCNYRCQYCWFCGRWHEIDKYNRFVSFDQIISAWKGIYDKYGAVHIDILGGEPFLFPRFVELIKELAMMHSIGITTNLSCDINVFTDKIDPEKVGIIPTFHPAFADYQKFLKRALLLKENKFGNSVYYLAYPLHIPLLASYKEKFNSKGLNLSILPFWGKYKGIDYPAGYTQEEKKIIEPELGDRGGEKHSIIPKRLKGQLCHAGEKYAVIFPDGTALRCTGGNQSNSVTFIGNNFFDNSFKLFDRPMSCNSEFCPCNEWVTWGIPESEVALAVQEAKEPVARTEVSPYCVFFTWYLNNECNYKCSFCKPRDYKTTFLPVKKWLAIWDRIYDSYGSCHIHISGGEPFIYPNFIKLIKGLSKKHTLEFSTNLSQDITPFIENISPKRVRLGGSFHPESGDFDEFLSNTVLLKNKKFDVWVNYVAYPPHLPEMARYKEAVEKEEIRFSIQPFNGTYNDREYPRQYTNEEKRLMTFGHIDEVNKQTIDWRTDGEKSSIKGMPCRMGQMYARIYPDGEVYRCCGNGALRLGSLLNNTFRLLDEPMPCECDTCPCWKCMLVGNEKFWQTFWTCPERANLIGHE